MSNAAGDIVNGLAGFLVVVVVFVAGSMIMSELGKQDPGNPVIQSPTRDFVFIARIFIDWSTPDPTIWLVRALSVWFGYKCLNGND